jgi:rhamnosyltransferase
MIVFAIIVIYNPKPDTLLVNLIAIRSQVNKIILIDNSTNAFDIDKFPLTIDAFFRNSNIGGIAHAQNIGIQYSIDNYADFILFMDQDSCPANNMVSILLNDFNIIKSNNINLAAIGPLPINSQINKPYQPRFRNRPSYFFDSEILDCNELISSGMLVDLKSLQFTGNLDENLFIDGVDHEWCWRAISKGFKLALSKKTTLLHSLGEGDKNILGFRIAITSSFRIYYQYRNYIYLLTQKHVPLKWKINNFIKYAIKFIYYPIFISPYYFKNILKGIQDGLYYKGKK